MINLFPYHENTLPVPVGKFVERSYYFFGYVIIFRAEQSKHGWWRMSIIIMDAEKAKVVQRINIEIPTLDELVYNIPTYLTWLAKRFTLGHLLFVSRDHNKYHIQKARLDLIRNIRNECAGKATITQYWVDRANARSFS